MSGFIGAVGGGVACMGVATMSLSQVSCDVPVSLAEGIYDVVVTNIDEQNSGETGVGLFTVAVS